jgi:hypothetical protein
MYDKGGNTIRIYYKKRNNSHRFTMENFLKLDSLELLSERLRRTLKIQNDAVTRASIKKRLERAKREIAKVPVQKKLKLENITVEELCGEGAMGVVWLVSFVN